MTLIDTNGIIAQVLNLGTTNITGSDFLTLFIIFIIFILVGMIFRLPIEIILVCLLPFVLALASYYAEFVGVMVVIFFFFAFLFAKWRFFS